MQQILDAAIALTVTFGIKSKHSTTEILGHVITVQCIQWYLMQIIGKGLVISYGEGGFKMGTSRVRNFLHPRVKLFVPPLLKSRNLLHPRFNIAKTSSS